MSLQTLKATRTTGLGLVLSPVSTHDDSKAAVNSRLEATILVGVVCYDDYFRIQSFVKLEL